MGRRMSGLLMFQRLDAGTQIRPQQVHTTSAAIA